MTQEDKQLLLVDLCARLPYGVIGVVKHYDEVDDSPADVLGTLQGFDNNSKEIKFVYLPDYTDDVGAYNWFSYIRFKPYLRPLSSMSDEEYEEFGATRLEHQLKCLEIDEKRKAFEAGIKFDAEDLEYLYSHHYDIRGLIPKGLALSTEEFNPYKD
jgi:hypothetical protein